MRTRKLAGAAAGAARHQPVAPAAVVLLDGQGNAGGNGSSNVWTPAPGRRGMTRAPPRATLRARGRKSKSTDSATQWCCPRRPARAPGRCGPWRGRDAEVDARGSGRIAAVGGEANLHRARAGDRHRHAFTVSKPGCAEKRRPASPSGPTPEVSRPPSAMPASGWPRRLPTRSEFSSCSAGSPSPTPASNRSSKRSVLAQSDASMRASRRPGRSAAGPRPRAHVLAQVHHHRRDGRGRATGVTRAETSAAGVPSTPRRPSKTPRAITVASLVILGATEGGSRPSGSPAGTENPATPPGAPRHRRRGRASDLPPQGARARRPPPTRRRRRGHLGPGLPLQSAWGRPSTSLRWTQRPTSGAHRQLGRTLLARGALDVGGGGPRRRGTTPASRPTVSSRPRRIGEPTQPVRRRTTGSSGGRPHIW